MDIYQIFNNLRYHYEDEVVEFKKAETTSTSMIWASISLR